MARNEKKSWRCVVGKAMRNRKGKYEGSRKEGTLDCQDRSRDSLYHQQS